MKVEAYIIAWNEAETIHLTIKHYQQFCDKITIFDNYSDDDTATIAQSMGCIVKPFGISGVLDDREYTNLKNNCWKGSDADLVIVVDADEILQYGFVEELKSGATIIRTYGWQVMAKSMPTLFWGSITHGFHDPNYSKLCCFNPRAVQEINYVHGCHVAKPVGHIQFSKAIYTLFHYRNVGGAQRLVDRHAKYRPRLSEWNVRFKAGDHYNHDDERRIREWNEQYERSGPYLPPGGWSSDPETTS